MMPYLRRCALLAALLLSVAPTGPVAACAYEAVPGNLFQIIHPGSLEVAVAMRKAFDDGLMAEPAATPAELGQAGYWAAVRRLDRLQALLTASPAAATLPPTSLVFIESALWSRVTPSAAGVDLQVHTEGAAAGDLVLVTGESVLTAVLDGRLTAATAFDRGLIRLDGDPAAIEVLRALLLQALSDPHISANAAQPALNPFAQ